MAATAIQVACSSIDCWHFPVSKVVLKGLTHLKDYACYVLGSAKLAKSTNEPVPIYNVKSANKTSLSMMANVIVPAVLVLASHL